LLVQLRSQWEFAAISQFLVQFRQTIELDDDYITEVGLKFIIEIITT